MKLIELDAQFLKIKNERTYTMVKSIKKADGVSFACPQCYRAKGNTLVGVHHMICWRPQVPQTVTPKPGRWEFEGKGLEDLTLVAGSSSVLIQGGCNAHFFVRNGEIQFC